MKTTFDKAKGSWNIPWTGLTILKSGRLVKTGKLNGVILNALYLKGFNKI